MTSTNKTLADLEAELLTAGIPEKSVAFIMGVLVSEISNRVAQQLRETLADAVTADSLDEITLEGDSELEKAYQAKTGSSIALLHEQISQAVAQEYSA